MKINDRKIRWIFNLIAILTLGIVTLSIGCFLPNEKKEMIEIKPESKLEVTVLSVHYEIYLINFEGHKYFGKYNGGFYHLESCPCKTNK